MDSVDGIISRVVFHKTSKFSRSGGKYLIAKLSDGTTVRGEMNEPRVGESYRFFGEWKENKQYGKGFEFLTHQLLIDQSADGVAIYLSNYVDGLGKIKAKKIVDEFGADTLTIMRTEPERFLEVPGISQRIVDLIHKHNDEQGNFDPEAYAVLADWFKGSRIANKVLVSLVTNYGSDAPSLVEQNPYMLLAFPSVGWKTADSLATTVLGYPADGQERHEAAIIESFARISQEGHTVASRVQVETEGFALLECPIRAEAWEALLMQTVLVAHAARNGTYLYSLDKYATAEIEIARRLAFLQATARPLTFPIPTEGLKGAQIDAVAIIEAHSPVCLVGPPGTGKSTVVSYVARGLIAGGMPASCIRVAAPTGKAAKRAAELLTAQVGVGIIESTTIHKLLGPEPQGGDSGVDASLAKSGRERDAFGFSRNENNPLPYHFLIIDETSMVDVCLFASFLKAVAPGTRLIFVGDQDQLPSIGPGSVLRDLIDVLPTAHLNEILRSDGGGRVVRACHAIRQGESPTPTPSMDLPTENWVHIEVKDPKKIAETIVELHSGEYQNFPDHLWDLQIISGQNHKLAFACSNLNSLLCQALNPNYVPPKSAEDQEAPFFVGDKIVRLKNGLVDGMYEEGKHEAINPDGSEDDEFVELFSEPTGKTWGWRGKRYEFRECLVVNGDMGTILDIVDDPKGTFVVVEFRNPSRLCRLPYGECELAQAYALTCHKAQGSGFPLVIIPVHDSYYWDTRRGTGIYSREWLYTAISRAEKGAITVGSFGSIRTAVSRKTIHQRRTKLRELALEALDPERASKEKARNAGGWVLDPPAARLGNQNESVSIEDFEF